MGEQVVLSSCVFASVFAIVQSTLWLVVHLSSILMKLEFVAYSVTHSNRTFTLIFEDYYQIFLDPHQGDMLGFYLHADNFVGVSVAYFILTLAWFFSSIHLFTTGFRRKADKAKGAMAAWTIITTVLSLVDLIVFAFVLVDFHQFKRVLLKYRRSIDYETAYAVQMLLSLRLIVFWLFNVAYVVVFVVALARKTYLHKDLIEWPGIFNSKVEAYNGKNHRLHRPPTPLPQRSAPHAAAEPNYDYVNGSYVRDDVGDNDDDMTLGSGVTAMFADVSGRPGNPRRSPVNDRPIGAIPVPPPLTPNPAYRNSITNDRASRRRNFGASSASNNDDRSNNDDLFEY